LEFGVSLVFGAWFLELSFIPLDNDEFRMTKSERSPKPEIRTKRLSLVTFGLPISDPGIHSLLEFRISVLIRHLEFVIRHSHRRVEGENIEH